MLHVSNVSIRIYESRVAAAWAAPSSGAVGTGRGGKLASYAVLVEKCQLKRDYAVAEGPIVTKDAEPDAQGESLT